MQEERIFTEQHRATLLRDGYVVIPGVVPAQECQRLHEQILAFHQQWNPEALKPEQPRSWTGQNMPPGAHGLNQFLGQQQWCWDIRQHPRVVQVFAELHGTQDLLCSMDGFRFHKAGSFRKPGYWAHTDQGAVPPVPGFDCVQGSVAICSSAHPSDGDLVVWRGAHCAHAGYFQQNPEIAKKVQDNWYIYPEEHMHSLERDGRPWMPDGERPEEPVPMPRVRIQRQAGDLVLWYSRMPHQSDPPQLDAQHDAAVVFVCMAPRRLATPKVLEKRKKAFEERRVTNHWPIGPMKLFGKHARTYNVEQRKIYLAGMDRIMQMPKPVLTPRGRRLVGYKE